MIQGYYLDYEENAVICREGDPSTDLYLLQSGSLLICTVNGTEVKALAKISPGEFIGELSFFDGRPRASSIITLEKSKILQIPKSELFTILPDWYTEIGKNITKKIRLLDQIIHEANIRRATDLNAKPLSIDEQRRLFEFLSK